ncbi:hypothetical protein BOX15_Mlig004334g1 [Macrostomum lignano]|uniref:Large ribosomal subunit protein eL6 n=1 Tax=Macrostomum lignano TaxID=282301 RepID=A0A267FI43_9PLAT|nr:hypothetical protein BOX15_Mlig004334g1 [Macrostomum lignano]
MASAQDEGMDFHKAFLSIDTDQSGEITVDELQSYCRKMNYQETFVQKWLMLFDADQNGRITYDEYCNALGLPPKKDVVAKHKSQQSKGKKSGKTARAVKVAKRRKEQEETRVTVETVKPPVQEEVVQAAAVAPVAASKAAAAGQAPQPPPSQAPSRRSRIRNEQLSYSGVMLHSRARVFQRKALYRLAKKSAANKLARKLKGAASTAAQQRPAVVEKPIGGDKNGGIRQVASRRQPRSLPTEPTSKPRRLRPVKTFARQRRRLRASIQPGSVLILLAGRHRGKRVVFLKQLASGLLLVTGPFKVNGCPLRRVCQSFVIATRTRLELGDLRLPERLNDAYFRRTKKQSKQKASSAAQDPFTRPEAAYQLAQERREDQKSVDSQVMSALVKLGRPDKKLMLGYLSSLFSLKSGQRPHDMVF